MFWLGVPLTKEATEGAVVCSFCDGPCAVFGDHVVCCKKTEFHSRQQAVVERFMQYFCAAGIKVEKMFKLAPCIHPCDEVGCSGDTPTYSLGLSSTAAATVVWNRAARKKAKYAQLVATHNLDFVFLPLSTFGELVEDCLEFVSQALSFYCAKHNLPGVEEEAQIRQQLSVPLTRQRVLRCVEEQGLFGKR